MQLRIPALIVFLTVTLADYAQFDPAYVRPLARPNSIGLRAAFVDSRFYFTAPDAATPRLNLYANTNVSVGPAIVYKWVKLSAGISLPGTQRSNGIAGIYNYRLRLNIDRNGGGAQININYFKGLIRGGQPYTAVKDLRCFTAAADLFYVQNRRRFSLKASRFHKEQQVNSSGSLLFHLTPAYSSFSQKKGTAFTDNVLRRYFTPQPQWITLTGSVGYAYNWVPGGGSWLVTPMLEGGFGGLYQFKVENHLRPASFVKGSLAAGYNGRKMLVFATAEFGKLRNDLGVSDLKEERFRLMLTAAYRMGSLQKKILGIL